jgi:hypothetical protein
MLFGSIDTFAIETTIEPSWCLPTAVWGRMRVWCRGVELGDFSERHCDLFGAYDGFRALSANLPTLWRAEFDGLSDDALYDRLDALVYGQRGDSALEEQRTPEQLEADQARYAPFVFLTSWGEQFEIAGKPFVVCHPGAQLCILNRTAPVSSVYALRVPPAEADRAIQDFLTWFDAELTRLASAVID